ncbi:hypothetical protein [Bacillus cereus]|uniref:Uncharacterized protein n=1 Tax=Bacillus cereus (strain VD014) TaxID=1053223 RepID=A0A9W5NSM4_BACC8|nr:hypothetical protein [Bacillus cereus]EJR25872.1 hypothetical protein IIA_00702 [Bacillus cereus VD014]KLA23052.1 hypothetical protein B4080_0795 [Bacillus cereus]MCU4823130.1 hypothetical protein [Bacillus cereus]MCU4855843.1 hypothetical protein [Bacillus cereus]MCU4872683.1 hypothetical protein [Bacillus cereus]
MIIAIINIFLLFSNLNVLAVEVVKEPLINAVKGSQQYLLGETFVEVAWNDETNGI